MNIKLTHKNAILPTRAHKTDAGLDCYASEFYVIEAGETQKIPLGFAIEIPIGFEMQIRGRSSLSSKGVLCHIGTVDSGYRGEISAILTNLTRYPITIKAGDRVAQAVIARYTSIHLNIVQELSDSDRGTGGFGSTGK